MQTNSNITKINKSKPAYWNAQDKTKSKGNKPIKSQHKRDSYNQS